MNPSLMSGQENETTTNQESIFRYCELHSTSLPDKHATLHANSVTLYAGAADKAVSALQGQLLQMLMRITRPYMVLELGCFMGYSAMAMADGMPRNSKLYTCEKDAKAAQLARELFMRHGYDHFSPEHTRQPVEIELLEGDAMSSLKVLSRNKIKFDVVFLDADKGSYVKYLNFILDHNLLAPDGYILADNVLFRGLVLQSNDSQAGASSLPPTPPPSPPLPPQSTNSQSGNRKESSKFQRTANQMDSFNKYVKNDPRVSVVVLPVFDGLSVIMRKNIP
ncbi:hypothetical protein BGZ54_006687 [Gamsiella multidivaricata]|nr:hypothetical protein BGZ54_006687 [Gamsiella multidivaricata]